MKKLNLNFLKTLIETDFALIPLSKNLSKSDLHNIDLVTSSYQSENKMMSLDFQELIKSLKQTLRLIQFINSKEKNQISIYSSNKQHLNLLGSELEDFRKKGKVSIKERFIKIEAVDSLTQLLLLIEDSLGNRQKILKKFFEDKIYLVNKINSKIEIKNGGVYKIRNSVDDLKKLVFLIVFLREALK